jgi:hypothetical protein
MTRQARTHKGYRYVPARRLHLQLAAVHLRLAQLSLNGPYRRRGDRYEGVKLDRPSPSSVSASGGKKHVLLRLSHVRVQNSIFGIPPLTGSWNMSRAGEWPMIVINEPRQS